VAMSIWTDALGKKIECIHRFGCCLVGLTHVNKNGQSRMELIRPMPIGTELVLVPVPDNPTDRDAILIYCADDLTKISDTCTPSRRSTTAR